MKLCVECEIKCLSISDWYIIDVVDGKGDCVWCNGSAAAARGD